MNPRDDTRDPEEIERDIERTRAEVGSTLDALQSKLTPGQLIDQAFHYLRSSAPADFTSNLSRTVRDNPVPVVLMGVGMAWLMAQGRRSHHPPAQVPTLGDEWDTTYGRPVNDGEAQADGSRWRERAAHARSAAHDTRERLSGSLHDKRERLSDSMHNARARAAEMRERSRDQVMRARGAMSTIVDEQPLVLGAIGVAIGAALGAGLPGTRREDELMGDARDGLLDQARMKAHEKADAVERTVRQAARDVRDDLSASGDEHRGDYPAQPRADETRPGSTTASAGMDGPH